MNVTPMNVSAYLFFDGRCDEALAFYKKAVGANVTMLMRFGEAPDQTGIEEQSKAKVMHAAVRIGETVVFVSDGMNKGQPNFDGFALSITTRTDGEAGTLFKALSEGGQVSQPLIDTFFASAFGMLRDKFGVNWMILTPKPTPGV